MKGIQLGRQKGVLKPGSYHFTVWPLFFSQINEVDNFFILSKIRQKHVVFSVTWQWISHIHCICFNDFDDFLELLTQYAIFVFYFIKTQINAFTVPANNYSRNVFSKKNYLIVQDRQLLVMWKFYRWKIQYGWSSVLKYMCISIHVRMNTLH